MNSNSPSPSDLLRLNTVHPNFAISLSSLSDSQSRATKSSAAWYLSLIHILPGCTDRCASLRGDRLPTPHHSEMVQQGLAENHPADTQVYDSQGMAAGICDVRFFQRDQPKMWKTLCRYQGNQCFRQEQMIRSFIIMRPVQFSSR